MEPSELHRGCLEPSMPQGVPPQKKGTCTICLISENMIIFFFTQRLTLQVQVIKFDLRELNASFLYTYINKDENAE